MHIVTGLALLEHMRGRLDLQMRAMVGKAHFRT
jgi:hypothetical protein